MAERSTTMTSTKMRTTLRAFMKAWNDHDVEGLMAKVTDDVVWVSPSSPQPLHGKEAAAADVKLTLATFPDLHFPKDDLHIYTTDDPDVGLTVWTMTGTMKGPMVGMEPTGKTARTFGVCLYRFQDGLIAEHRIVFDRMGFVQDLGLIPHEEDVSFKAMAGMQRLTVRTKRALHV